MLRPKFWDLICFAVLCVVLTLGLWPFHSPVNDVTWLGNRNGLRFGRFGTAISPGALQMTGAESVGTSVEVWLQSPSVWASATILAFYTPGNRSPFSLRQSLTDLELTSPARLYVGDAFRKNRPAFLTIASGTRGTAVYIDGVLSRRAPQFQIAAKAFTGRLVLGGSPRQTDSWSGQLLGLAVYARELAATQVLRHYETWTQTERPEISAVDRNVVLYLFDDRAGNIVHDRAGSGLNLEIPEKYAVLDQIALEPFWKEFSMSQSYWNSALKNIVGFVPFGFCFFACLSAHGFKRPAWTTVILGTLVSLTIEVLQAYLPTRDSGTTDLFTNTLGTYFGVITYRVARPFLARQVSNRP